MIKGRFYGAIQIDIEVDEAKETLKPFYELHDLVHLELANYIAKILQDAFNIDGVTVRCEKQFADLRRIK